MTGYVEILCGQAAVFGGAAHALALVSRLVQSYRYRRGRGDWRLGYADVLAFAGWLLIIGSGLLNLLAVWS